MTDMKTLVGNMREYFYGGETLSAEFRINSLSTLLNTVIESEDEIIEALHADLNKSKAEAYMTEIGVFKNEAEYALKHINVWAKPRLVSTPVSLLPSKCYQVPEPYGVALIMAPWNYPFLMSMQPLVGAIAAGNCAVIKPSAYAPNTSRVVKNIIEKCFDPLFCTVVEGGREENRALLDTKFDYIFFTGSPSVGREIMMSASKYLTPVTLELGGKSPVIVDETANIDIAAERIVFGKFINCGQTCIAPDYVFVHESMTESFISNLRKYIDKFYPKDKNDMVIDYPCIINQKHYDRISGLIQEDKIVIGGKKYPSTRQIEPTVLLDVELDSPVMQQEIFGPILPVIQYGDINDVITEIRSRPKPLAMYIFTEDSDRSTLLTEHVSFGGGCINDCIVHIISDSLPFGGVGESGMGCYHGEKTFETFTHYKSIVSSSSKVDLSIRYRPYDRIKLDLIKKFQ